MARIIDEEDRFEFLAKIAKHYPDQVDLASLGVSDADVLRATLTYFEEKGLLKVQWVEGIDGRSPGPVAATARGYDAAEKSGYLDD